MKFLIKLAVVLCFLLAAYFQSSVGADIKINFLTMLLVSIFFSDTVKIGLDK